MLIAEWCAPTCLHPHQHLLLLLLLLLPVCLQALAAAARWLCCMHSAGMHLTHQPTLAQDHLRNDNSACKPSEVKCHD
jgi:hypothetical protein